MCRRNSDTHAAFFFKRQKILKFGNRISFSGTSVSACRGEFFVANVKHSAVLPVRIGGVGGLTVDIHAATLFLGGRERWGSHS
jgi:hypothetical protein